MPTKLSDTFLDQATVTLRAIGHPIRLKILELLFSEQELSVTEIHEALVVPQPVISNHLRILKDRGVVSSVRKGQNSLYKLNHPDYFQIIHILKEAMAK